MYKPYICFVWGDAWIYTFESGTSGPATREQALNLPMLPNIVIPDRVSVECSSMTKEDFLKAREDRKNLWKKFTKFIKG